MTKEYLTLIERIKSLTSLKTEERENDIEYNFSIHSEIKDVYWITFAKNEKDIIVGINLVHEHFDGEINPVKMGLPYFKDILTNDIVITHFFRGSHNYKTQYEIIKDNAKENIGSAAIPCLYFWKKKSKHQEISKRVISPSL